MKARSTSRKPVLEAIQVLLDLALSSPNYSEQQTQYHQLAERALHDWKLSNTIIHDQALEMARMQKRLDELENQLKNS